jgi:hypothetical protein
MEESWAEQLSASRALTWSYPPYLMSREIVVFWRCTSFGNYPNEKTRPLSQTIEVSAILALSSNADEYQRPQDTADPNRSAAFLHPLQEDCCLAVVSKDLGAGKLVLGYSLFTVVRASNESTRLTQVSPFSKLTPLTFRLGHTILVDAGLMILRYFEVMFLQIL